MTRRRVFHRLPTRPDYNKRFAAPARESGDAFVPLGGVDLDDILCVKEDRVVGHDNCVSYRPDRTAGTSRAAASAFHEHADGGCRCSTARAASDADGSPVATA